MNCFHCGRQIELRQRIGFRETCPECDRGVVVVYKPWGIEPRRAMVAEMAGVSRQAISAVESGVSDPSLRVAIALTRALGLTVEELFGTDDTVVRSRPGRSRRWAAREQGSRSPWWETGMSRFRCGARR